ncbi:MAG: UDP-glucose/GDP-mannose dehydrogenase family protein [Candidatus Stygibacter australis]|nr:UDP-glucose/GDP-mannose dehydrogenase family protein [Candidatus Stygibacter australis]MDP8323433.1 UDP-glucose/GDP-mannose dehydrogenase family protein [Candidatus Stygibacter australis]
MKIAVIGTGYVGLVTGTCFAEMGNQVICVDNNIEKINMLNRGEIPIWEPGLESMVNNNVEQSRLCFTTDIASAVKASEICFIAVGTPPGEDGSADLQYVLAVAADIAHNMDSYKIIVDKSTVPVGTADLVGKTVKAILTERNVDYSFDVVSNPEFLKEGSAIADSMKPDRVIVGTDNPKVGEVMQELYEPFSRSRDKTIIMSVRSAEMTKYAANAMLATKISFMNDIANLCDILKADVEDVRKGIGSDSRIGYQFIYPGVGYGGSCFPKDVKALIKMALKEDTHVRVLEAVEAVNDDQKDILVQKVKDYYNNDLKGKIFAMWGLAFKPKTDDMREAPSIRIIKGLIAAGARVIAYDPVATETAKKAIGKLDGLTYGEDNYSICEDADGLLVVTEWNQFRNPDFTLIKSKMRRPVIFDGRNVFKPQEVRKSGFDYFGIGRV